MDYHNIFAGIKYGVKEVIEFGPLFLLRHLEKGMGWQRMKVRTRSLERIKIRPQDTDAGTFNQVFIGKGYDFSIFSQKQRILPAYHSMLSSGITPVIVDAGANAGAAIL
jgi:hypothetical protein